MDKYARPEEGTGRGPLWSATYRSVVYLQILVGAMAVGFGGFFALAGLEVFSGLWVAGVGGLVVAWSLAMAKALKTRTAIAGLLGAVQGSAVLAYSVAAIVANPSGPSSQAMTAIGIAAVGWLTLCSTNRQWPEKATPVAPLNQISLPR